MRDRGGREPDEKGVGASSDAIQTILFTLIYAIVGGLSCLYSESHFIHCLSSPNPVINEYQLEEQHNFLLFFFPVDKAEEDVVSCLSILIKFKKRFTEKQSMVFVDSSNMKISIFKCSIKDSSLRASTAICEHLVI